MKIFRNLQRISLFQNQIFCVSQFPDIPKREMLPKGEQQIFNSIPRNVLQSLAGYQQKKPLPYYFAVEHDKKIYHVFDASRMPYGKMCQQIALFIMGKHKPTFRQNQNDQGDRCVVVNAENILMKGSKKVKKVFRYHSGYVGNLKEIKYTKFMEEKPEQLISWQVNRQMPKNRLREARLENLSIFRTYQTNLNFLPHFKCETENLEDKEMRLYGSLNEMFPKDQTEIIYQTAPMEEFKDYKVNIDTEIEIPFEERKTIASMTSLETKIMNKKMVKLKKILKRQKIYESKTKFKKQIEKNFTLIRSDKQQKKLGIQLPGEDEEEIEDESLPQR